MNDKMPEGQKAVIVNVAILVTLVLCYFKGYPLTAILISGIVLLFFANALMFAKRRKLREGE